MHIQEACPASSIRSGMRPRHSGAEVTAPARSMSALQRRSGPEFAARSEGRDGAPGTVPAGESSGTPLSTTGASPPLASSDPTRAVIHTPRHIQPCICIRFSHVWDDPMCCTECFEQAARGGHAPCPVPPNLQSRRGGSRAPASAALRHGWVGFRNCMVRASAPSGACGWPDAAGGARRSPCASSGPGPSPKPGGNSPHPLTKKMRARNSAATRTCWRAS